MKWSAEPGTVDVTAKSTDDMQSNEMVDLLNLDQTDAPWTIDPSMNDGYPIFVSMAVSIPEMNAASMNVIAYPTPFEDYILVDSKDVLNEYALIDISGRIVCQGMLKGNETRIDSESLKSGSYVLRIHTAEGVIGKQIIKN